MARPSVPGDTWTCYARPAAAGRTCGHVNDGGGQMFRGLECCSSCGCTRKASDDRRLAADRAEGMRRG